MARVIINEKDTIKLLTALKYTINSMNKKRANFILFAHPTETKILEWDTKVEDYKLLLNQLKSYTYLTVDVEDIE